MMKEWKNNPGSDEESTTDQRNNWSGQEKLKGYQPSRSIHVSNSSDEEEGKQVGRTNCSISPNCKIPSQHLEHFFATLFCCWFLMVCNKGDLHDTDGKVLSSLETIVI